MTNPSDDTAAPDRLKAWKTIRGWVLGGIGAGAVIGTAASFYESFSGLVDWFRRVGFHGDRAVYAPLMIDLVAAFGEVVLVFAIVEGWKSRTIRPLAWAAIIWGLVLSVIGNAGRTGLHLTVTGIFDMAWNAVPPMSLAILMTVALAVVKLWFKGDGDSSASGVSGVYLEALVMFAGHIRESRVPTIREVMVAFRCGQPKAVRIRAYLETAVADLAALDDAGEGRERTS